VHDKVAHNPDYALSMQDIREWEHHHGRIPTHAFVAMRTDWSKRWPNQAAMQNQDAKGVGHYPAWSLPVLQFLINERHVAAIGHETTDTDGGIGASHDNYSLESYVLGTNHYQIEMLAHLDQVPPAGALVMVTFPKPAHGTGFPARVIMHEMFRPSMSRRDLDDVAAAFAKVSERLAELSDHAHALA